MFQLTSEEWESLRSQTVISNSGRGGRRTAPYAFTEQGVAMLSSVLGSARAIAVNIEVMRTFVRVRQLAATHSDLAKRLSELEDKTELLAMGHEQFSHNTRAQLKKVFEALRELMTPPEPPAPPPKQPIGFIRHEDKGTGSSSSSKGSKGKTPSAAAKKSYLKSRQSIARLGGVHWNGNGFGGGCRSQGSKNASAFLLRNSRSRAAM